VVMNATAARNAILSGQAPDGLTVPGHLYFWNQPDLTRLPEYLQVDELDVRSCSNLLALPNGLSCHALTIINGPITALPADIDVTGSITLSACERLRALPTRLSLHTLEIIACPMIETLPADLRVSSKLVVSNSSSMKVLPRVAAKWQIVRNCPDLETLPEDMQALSLTIDGCPSLTDWPRQGPPIMRRLTIRNCEGLRALPPWLIQVDELTIRDCPNLLGMPDHLYVRSWMEIAGTPLRRLPLSSRGIRLRWRGVPISGQAVFHPETLKAESILKEQNAEKRRVLLERMGYERFVAEAQATTLDSDQDVGGARRLLHVPLADDEPLVCLAVLDPSTGRQYLIRVPPNVQTCHQAAAWIAGFDNPDDYHPVAET